MKEYFYASLVAFLGAYLLGSANFAIIISRIVAKDDVRAYGSKNAGATNMLRTYGKKLGALTFLMDFLKGLLAVSLAGLVYGYFAPEVSGQLQVIHPYIAGLGVLLGHIFPVYFKFKGGKGMATGLGVLCGCSFPTFVMISVIFVPLIGVTGYVSFSSITGAMAFPIMLGLVRYFQHQFYFGEVLVAVPIACILVASHHQNIKRLLAGTENKISFKK